MTDTLTRAQILAEPAGPTLDAWVLERVCGWTKDEHGWRDGERRWRTHERVSISDGACWRWVVPALNAKAWGVSVESCDAEDCGWHVTVMEHASDREYHVRAPTPALALCRAAVLTTMEGE